MPDETPDKLSPPQNDDAVTIWLEARLNSERPYLLAHADDGVIWGRLVEQRLMTSWEVADHKAREFSPPLRGVTLQQAFVFGPAGEVRLWRDDSGWQFHQFTTTDEQRFEALLDEWQVLWGTEVIKTNTQHGFTHIREARQQGLNQIVPIDVNEQQLRERSLRLHVRHFIERDPDTGEARIAFSRLVNLEIKSE
jgi:CRISPR-associated protein (TIGR03984 family)